MMKTGNCDYRLTITYDDDPDGVSLDEEIEHPYAEMFNIAESHRCSFEADIHEVGGRQAKLVVPDPFSTLAKIAASGRSGLIDIRKPALSDRAVWSNILISMPSGFPEGRGSASPTHRDLSRPF